MKWLHIFLFEWKHFLRAPFKIVAVLLFLISAIYGLHNGSYLYHKQVAEIEEIHQTMVEDQEKYLEQYEQGELSLEDRPWVDMSTPFWAIWLSQIHHMKEPSAAMVYNIGQAEQYGFYKRVSIWASPFDEDMAEEIANPERLQTGTLDFSFVLLFLLPLLLLILLYNVKSGEAEGGFLPLIAVQTASGTRWLLLRLTFYILLCAVFILGLLIYGASLTGVFQSEGNAFGQLFSYALLYLILWAVVYFFVLKFGETILGNTLKMIGVWILFVFVVPGVVHQFISIQKPANLMTNLIDAQRDDAWELYDESDSVIQAKLFKLFPEIEHSPVAKDTIKIKSARRRSMTALENELLKESIRSIEEENQSKNDFVKSAYWYNPVSFFQNRLNAITGTNFDAYKTYRDEIQFLVDKQIKTMVIDTWNEKEVDKKKYQAYLNELKRF